MESWPRQTATISTALQLSRSEQIFAICRDSYLEFAVPPSHDSREEGGNQASSSSKDLLPPAAQPRTNVTTYSTARTIHVLPASDATTATTTSNTSPTALSCAASVCTRDDHVHPSGDYPVQAPGRGGVRAVFKDAASAASSAVWSDREWSDWQEAWHGWVVRGPQQDVSHRNEIAAAYPADFALFQCGFVDAAAAPDRPFAAYTAPPQTKVMPYCGSHHLHLHPFSKTCPTRDVTRMPPPLLPRVPGFPVEVVANGSFEVGSKKESSWGESRDGWSGRGRSTTPRDASRPPVGSMASARAASAARRTALTRPCSPSRRTGR